MRRRTTTFYDVLPNTTTHYFDVLRDTTAYNDVLRRITKYYDIPRSTMTYYEILYDVLPSVSDPHGPSSNDCNAKNKELVPETYLKSNGAQARTEFDGASDQELPENTTKNQHFGIANL